MKLCLVSGFGDLGLKRMPCGAQRQVGDTALNDKSSRSHQIIRLTVQSSLQESSGCVKSFLASLSRQKEWPHTIRGFKAYTNTAVFTWGKCSYSHYLYHESCFKLCGANEEYTLICN